MDIDRLHAACLDLVRAVDRVRAEMDSAGDALNDLTPEESAPLMNARSAADGLSWRIRKVGQ